MYQRPSLKARIDWERNRPSVIIKDEHYATSEWEERFQPELKPLFTQNYEFKPIPLDPYGLWTPLFFKLRGANIIKSEITVSKETSLCGKFQYAKAYRVDTHLTDQNPYYFYISSSLPNNKQELPFSLDLLTDADFQALIPEIKPPSYRRNVKVHLDTGLLRTNATVTRAEWNSIIQDWQYILHIPTENPKHPIERRAEAYQLHPLPQNQTIT